MTLTNVELTELLDRLLAGWENEVVEFKGLIAIGGVGGV